MNTNYENLLHQKCKMKDTGKEVWVLSLWRHHPTSRHPEGRIWAHIDGDGIQRGTEVPAEWLELV